MAMRVSSSSALKTSPQGGQVSLNLAVSGPPGMRVLSRLIPGAVSALGIVEPIVKDEDMNFVATGNLNTAAPFQFSSNNASE